MIINDVHATDAVTTPYKRLLEELSKAGKDSQILRREFTFRMGKRCFRENLLK